MIIKCFIIEDEPLAQNVLKKYIADTPLLQLAGTFSDTVEAQSELLAARPDLLFLDINLPKLSGTNFLKTLHNPPLVVFTTAYPAFAVEGFELNAVDYLLKPFSFSRFIHAVNKVAEKMQYTTLANGINTEAAYLFIKVDKKMVRVNTGDILFAEALDDYVKLVTASREYLTHSTLKNMQGELPPSQFMRVHKSFLVATGKIDYIEGNYIKMGTRQVPIGAVYKEEVLALVTSRRG